MFLERKELALRKVLSLRKPLLLSVIVTLCLLLWPSSIALANAEEINRSYRVVEEEETGEIFFVQDSPQIDKVQKQKVAVALGGGGARALVNVGILKALEEEGIPVDLVVGSSMGAIVAVLYGSGMPLATIEELVTSDILPSMFDLNFPFLYSVIDTRRVNYFIERVLPHQRLEEFPIQTALLSYDLTHGVKYVHTSGLISREIQGSYSIPLFFPVVDYDGLFLMDPGILELTPAQAAKVLGADVVIATTAFDELPYNTYAFPVRAVTRFINIFKDRNSKAIIDRYSDATINCNVGDYSFMDYHLAADFIALGYHEAQKLIPEIKRILAEKEIPLNQSPEHTPLAGKGEEEQLNLAQVLRDIKYERLQYDFTRIKPLLYFGRGHSFFKQELIREEATALQYGFLWQKGKLDLRGLTRGKGLDNYALKLKFIGLTRDLDLIGKLHYEETPKQDLWGYGVDLKYYQPNFTLTCGWAELDHTSYLHNAGTFDLNWGEHQLRSGLDLYTPAASQGLTFTETKYVAVQSLKISAYDNLTLQPRLVVSNTQSEALFAHPLIYRGIEPDTAEGENLVQSALEIAYHYRFPYSLELLQCIQLKELTWFSFIDLYYRLEPYYAVGAGLTCELNLLGIKPSSFGGYVVYDLAKTSWKGALSIDLSL